MNAMKEAAMLVSTLLLAVQLLAQDDHDANTARIVEEGKRLYKSEMASWYGTDVFLEKYKDRNLIGGYFSYIDNNSSKCIFFSKGETPKVIGTITFDSTYNTGTAQADLTERAFTTSENDLYHIRTEALKIVNADTFFKAYHNTSMNVIPLIADNERKVYILTASQKSGQVIIGNDYLLTFNDQYQLTGKKKFHQNILLLEYGKQQTDAGEGVPIGAMHTHLPETGDYITPTDICTLMLYAQLAGWQQHMVVSNKYVNIWNCQTNKLIVISRNVFDKINKDQEKRRKKN